MDLKNFKKIGLSKSGKTTVFKHKDGHFLHVAHGALIPKHKKDMDALPCAEGGDIDDNGPPETQPTPMLGAGYYDQGGTVPQAPSAPTPQGISQGFKKATGFAGGGSVHEPLEKNSGTSKAGAYVRSNVPHANELAKNEHKRTLQNMQAQPAPKLLADGTPDGGLPSVQDAMQPDVSGAQTGMDLGTSAYNPNAAADVDPTADSKPFGGEAPATPQQAFTAPQQSPQGSPGPTGQNPMRQWLDKEDTGSMSDLAQGHIKPETYQSLYAKKDTLGKIGTLFGMLVGGIGSGITHQPNALMEMMDKTISRDLDAQKSSASNAQNFLKMAQQNPLVQQQARLTGANADQTSQAVALIHTTNATFHDLQSKVQNMPESTPEQAAKKQQAMQALTATATFFAPKVANAKDVASSFMQPVNGEQQQPQNQGDIQPILHKGAPNQIQGLQFSPTASKDYKDVMDQYTQANQAQKALDNLGPTFDRLSGDMSASGRIAQEANDSLDRLPFGIGQAISGPITAMTNLREGNRDYHSAQTSLISDITNALRGTNIHGDEITKIVTKNTPVKGDSPEEIQRKRDTIEGFIKRAVPTTLLKKYGLTNE